MKFRIIAALVAGLMVSTVATSATFELRKNGGVLIVRGNYSYNWQQSGFGAYTATAVMYWDRNECRRSPDPECVEVPGIEKYVLEDVYSSASPLGDYSSYLSHTGIQFGCYCDTGRGYLRLAAQEGTVNIKGTFDGQQVSFVPEPATWAMMITGFGAIGGAMRRRRGQVSTTVRFA